VPLVPIFWFLLNATTIVASATAVFWLVRCIELAHGRPRRERWAIQHRYERCHFTADTGSPASLVNPGVRPQRVG
jgi:hypothetical protein